MRNTCTWFQNFQASLSGPCQVNWEYFSCGILLGNNCHVEHLLDECSVISVMAFQVSVIVSGWTSVCFLRELKFQVALHTMFVRGQWARAQSLSNGRSRSFPTELSGYAGWHTLWHKSQSNNILWYNTFFQHIVFIEFHQVSALCNMHVVMESAYVIIMCTFLVYFVSLTSKQSVTATCMLQLVYAKHLIKVYNIN